MKQKNCCNGQNCISNSGKCQCQKGATITKQDLSDPRIRLVELMQQVNYGRIQGLRVKNGEPVFDPPPSVLRLVLFGKDNGPNAACMSESFTLKKKVTELFETFDHEQSLLIQELIIENGLPVRMIVADLIRV